MNDYESWRPALIAFWKRDGSYQRAENLSRNEPMDALDLRTIDGLKAAAELAPMRDAA